MVISFLAYVYIYKSTLGSTRLALRPRCGTEYTQLGFISPSTALIGVVLKLISCNLALHPQAQRG